ncbi:MAG: SDR family NAD(P)-dependent oxidoreductase [Burkholderiaceae bacterium]|nr:SDR family NAD(P)-dependent oxidoreductase [Desulfobacterales bacterium]MDP3135189.1 SDR family NAD(P)-dependent oxidoreductase [Burkholderiaceae bacterium]
MSTHANKIAIITGGAGGIGAAVAQALLREGAQVALFDLDPEALKRTAQALSVDGGRVHTECVDVTDAADVARACARVEKALGGVDYLVNVAGGRGNTSAAVIEAMTPEEWAHVIDLNLTAPFNCMKACAPAIRRRGGGAIVTIGSIAGLRISLAHGASYTAAKAGVLGLTRQAGFEFARDNIRVNAVLPGVVLTPQLKKRRDANPSAFDPALEAIPQGRFLQPEEIAAPVLFFLSPAASGCTGAYLLVDGGMHIGSPSSPGAYFKTRRGA